MTEALTSYLHPTSPAHRLYELFRGAETRHGTYDQKRLRLVGSKMEMKDESGKGPQDVKGPPTPELWEKHLAGVRPLGVSPLREDGKCRWGVIDIDVYDLNLPQLAQLIEREELPLVLSRSKSGGGHAWLFSTDWVPQADMSSALTSLASRLGHPDVETYPPSSGSGNWMNMIGWKSTERCGIKPNGLEMSVSEFVSAAVKRQQSLPAISALATKPSQPTSTRGTVAGRQLLQIAAEITSAATGGRAKLIYGKAKDMGRHIAAERIDEVAVIDALVDASMRAGLSYSEAIGHVRNGIKDGKQEPADSRGGNGGRYAQIDKIVILTGGEEKLWRVSVSGYGDITLPAKYVWRNDLFNQRCAEELRAGFRQMKADAWADRLNDALEVAETEALPREETVEGAFFDCLQAFCTDKHRAYAIEEVLWRKPFWDDDAGRVYFRFADFLSYLRESVLFKGMTMHGIGRMLRGIGHEGVDLGKTTKKLKGKTTELYWLRSGLFEGVGAEAQVALPPIDRPPL